MSWPFPEYIRPLMRSVLYYEAQGQTEEEIRATLTGPPHRHPESWVDMAIPEARRSKLFAENVEAFGGEQSLGQIWDRYWLSIFAQAYGRRPTEQEMAWAQSRPGASVGLMMEVTVEGVEGFRYTPTVNVPWDATLDEVRQNIRDWFITGRRSPAPPGSAASAIEAGATINVNMVGGALVPRIEPTITLGRG